MTEIPLLNDFTALGLVALVLVLGYYMITKLLRILTEHLEKTVRRQDTMIELLRECLMAQAVKESFHNLDKH